MTVSGTITRNRRGGAGAGAGRARRWLAVAGSGLVLSGSAALGGAALGSGVAAADPPVRTPGLDEVFTPYIESTFTDGRLATPGEVIDGLRADDPFYEEPPLDGEVAPGTLLKSKPVQVMFGGVRPAHLDAHKVMYVTRGVQGQQVISTGILMIPRPPGSGGPESLIGYQEANDSVGPGCHPSTQWTGGDQLDPAAYSALGPLALMFDRGMAVMISDVGNDADQDPHGVFAGQFSGRANLDGLRAALQVPGTGLADDVPIGLFGIAGGGVGAAMAAELQPTYAPELDVRSAVLEGMVVDQRNFMRVADGSVGSGFAFANLLGLEPWYPEMKIDEKLTPLGRQIADFYRDQCQLSYFSMPFVPLNLLFESGLNPADIPDFQHAYDDNVLGRSAPEAKVLITSCGADDSPMSLVPAKDSRELAEQYRAGGTDVTYAPSDCSMAKLLSDPYGWGTDLFGMQTIDWLAESVGLGGSEG
ncbi:lipase family protein [Tomitella gaofuii]|uniref:lipase family protein n=1 Tax=Tomitella gaofuii TaxID=2760083 RepID=UPI0015FD7685|nr:lipase family protein [Tomitella gaofuii]